MGRVWVPPSHISFFKPKKYVFTYLKMKENIHMCQNGKIKMFDSSLSKINIPTNEHLVYLKIMTS